MALLNHKAIIATAYTAMTSEQISNLFKGAHAVAKLGMIKGAGYHANFAKALKDAHVRFQHAALNAAYKKLNVRISGNTYNHLKTIKSQADVKFNGASKVWEGKINFDGYEYITKYCHGVTVSILGDLPVINKGVAGVTVPCKKCGTYCFGDCEPN